VVHLGDLGHVLKPGQAEAIGRADVVLAPVGGHFTIDKDEALQVVEQLAAKVVVPMHFKTEKVDFPIVGVEAFLAKVPDVKRLGNAPAEVTATSLPVDREVWLMDPAR
jgi:L-ascorbate metabolism protein UlaG (beta-lactamase superfamily)